jgi:hypothetical protein
MGYLSSLKVLQKGPAFPAPMRAALPHKPTLFGKLAMERWIFFSRAVDNCYQGFVTTC